MTTPMTEVEARAVAEFIAGNLPDVWAGFHGPGEMLRLAWDRASVELFHAALTSYQATGNDVPQFVIDNLRHWLDHVADSEDGEDPNRE